ncbi:MAG: hypothetical protein JWO22_1592 [Frankiales bacterium]|nr:hypothetical protein [Frankiales bacterium]
MTQRRKALAKVPVPSDPEGVDPQKVTPEEDATMRRLHWFERFGADLSPQLKVVKASIRSRDKRALIRDPEQRA